MRTVRIGALLFSLLFFVDSQKYKPNWDSIDSRPLPGWFDDGKFGIFMHWGVYSVPAFRSEWMWWYWQGETPDKEVVNYVQRNYPPGTSYADFARDFKAELFNPDTFREIVEASGAKYFVITSKHHEGFTMWPSKTSWNWNAVDVGPKRDLIGALRKSFLKSKVHFGLYFSLFEWFHPLYLADHAQSTTDYVDQVSYPQLLEIVNAYEPDVVWSDGEWGDSDTYWKSKEFLAWLYNDSPVKDRVVVNDRWGKGTAGHHGGYMTYADHYDPGHLLPRKWENCMTLDVNSWGHRRNMQSADVRSAHEVIEQLARTISCGGNLLLNVGPDMHGMIPPIFEERLRDVGAFVTANAEAIYGSKPWCFQNDTHNVWYTSKHRTNYLPKDRVYNVQDETNTVVYAWLITLDLPDYDLLNVKATEKTKVSILSTGTPLTFKTGSKGQVVVSLQDVPWHKLPRTDVLVLKVEYAASSQHNPLLLLKEKRHLRSNKHYKRALQKSYKH